MKSLLFLLLISTTLLQSCACREGRCGVEFPIKPNILAGNDRLTDIQYIYGIQDGNRGNPNWSQSAPNLFEVSSYGFEHFRAQERPDWCWVAAIQMVLNYQGIDISQCEIVKRLGMDCNAKELQLGSASDVVVAMNGWDINSRGRASAVQATTLAVSNGTSLISDVSTNWPVIVGLKGDDDQPGHVYVLTAVEYSWKPGTWNHPVFWEVELYNPWPGEGREWMYGSEFADRIQFAARMRVQHF